MLVCETVVGFKESKEEENEQHTVVCLYSVVHYSKTYESIINLHQ